MIELEHFLLVCFNHRNAPVCGAQLRKRNFNKLVASENLVLRGFTVAIDYRARKRLAFGVRPFAKLLGVKPNAPANDKKETYYNYAHVAIVLSVSLSRAKCTYVISYCGFARFLAT